ncbi:MAG: hypothetical protein QE271_11865 [Bacteriovoracaceae bacterium]|nr:hypothetical protein [Bacteriovoracaceae bacterium]
MKAIFLLIFVAQTFFWGLCPSILRAEINDGGLGTSADLDPKKNCYHRRICNGDDFSLKDYSIRLENTDMKGEITENLNLKFTKNFAIVLFFNDFELPTANEQKYWENKNNSKLTYYYLTNENGFDARNISQTKYNGDLSEIWSSLNLIWKGKFYPQSNDLLKNKWQLHLDFSYLLKDLHFAAQDGILVLKFEKFLNLPTFFIILKTKAREDKSDLIYAIPEDQKKNFLEKTKSWDLKNLNEKKIKLCNFTDEYTNFWRKNFQVKFNSKENPTKSTNRGCLDENTEIFRPESNNTSENTSVNTSVYEGASFLNSALNGYGGNFEQNLSELKRSFKKLYSRPSYEFYQKMCDAFYPLTNDYYGNMQNITCRKNATSVIDISKFYFIHQV